MHRDLFTIYSHVPSLVYLDSAATSLTLSDAVFAMDEYYSSYRSNIHRGLYASAERASEAYDSAKESIAELVGTDANHLVITSGATMSSNLLTLLIQKNIHLTQNDEIVVSRYAHNSELLPLQELSQSTGAKLVFGHEHISSRTKVVSITLVSNVLGMILPAKDIAEKAREVGAFVCCDATAALSHIDIDVESLGVDALYASMHKALGPTGIGFLYLSSDCIKHWKTAYTGGGMVTQVREDQSDYVLGVGKFEAGTPPIAEVIGAGKAAHKIREIGMNTIHTHIQEVLSYAYDELKKLPYIEIYSELKNNAGIISFNMSGVHSHDVAQILAEEGVCIRAGAHCAHVLVNSLPTQSVCRISFHLYNTNKDIDVLIQSLQKAHSIFS